MTRRAAARGAATPPRSDCPIACTLDLIGDRWTLLIVRDLMLGKRRFSEFLTSGEGVTTNILAARLKRLERAGLVERSRYQEHPPRSDYHLTQAGQKLAPVLKEMLAWGREHPPGVGRRPAARSRGLTGG